METYTDTLVVIPTRRTPPIKTIENYSSDRFPFLLVADPSTFAALNDAYVDHPYISVSLGKQGLIPQVLELYKQTALRGYKYFFRLDDDLQKNYFVDYVGRRPSLDEVILLARQCLDVTNTTLAGFANTSRTDWLGMPGEFKRSSGLIHGGAQICIASETPEQFLDPRLPRYEDVYRSASHRKLNGAVGRVSWIGLDKRESLRDSVASKTPEEIELAKEIILGAFPGMVTCKGTRTLDGGRQVIPNWRLVGRATALL